MGLERSTVEYLVRLLEPLILLSDSDEFADLLDLVSWDATTLGVSATALAADTAALSSALNSAAELAAEGDMDLATVATTLVSLGEACANLVKTLSSLTAGAGVPTNALTELGEDLLAFLVEGLAAGRFPWISLVAVALGFATRVPVPQLAAADGTVLRPATTRLVLDFTALDAALRDPLGYARTTLLADPQGVRRAADAIADLAGPGLAEGLVGAGLTAGYGIIPVEPGLNLTPAEQAAAAHLLLADFVHTSAGVAEILRIALGLTDQTNQQGLGLLIAASGDISISAGPLTLTLSGAQQPLVITGQSVKLAAGSSGPVTFDAAVQYVSTAQPAISLGSASSTNVQVASVQAGVDVSVTAGSVDVGGGVSLTGVALQIRAGDGDGFLSAVLPADPIELRADLDLDLSLRNGVRVHAAGGLQWTAAINKSLGPVELNEIAAALALSDGAVSLQLTATLGLALGPLDATIDAVGIAAALRQAATAGSAPASGNAGPYALTVGFKAPDGAGLSLDAGVATGGGFIECDAAKGQYAGVLELALESLSLTAIGLIQTKMADGSPLPGGFSLLVIISVEFTPGIELGFGFSLNGVGGFLGWNRTMNVDALRAGVHSGSLDDIMFPADPVGHAPQIIQELAGFFPAAPGRFLIGPMVQIQWGSPLPILTADLGVIIELPAPVRIAILGVLQIGLPQADEDAVILLNLDVLGVVDFGLGTLSLDASLYGSRIAEFPVGGDMALRLGWKAEREFIAAVGGCHPATQPPPDFPTLNRLAISLSSSDKFTFTLQAYFATTSNTIQFGAKAHLLADTGQARLDGIMSFDALIHTHPFGLEVDFAAAVTVWVDGNQLLAVTVAGQLTGPSPWQVSGQASIHVFFISATVSFHFQLGSAAALLLPVPVQVIDLLVTDVQQLANWSALPPPGETVVTLTPAPSSGTEMRAHPLGSLTVHQRTVPLGITIDKFGAADVAGPAKLTVTSISYGDSTVDPAAVTPVNDAFAPGQFLRLSDSDALSQPAFTTYQAGVAFTPADPSFDDLAAGDVAPVGYTVYFIDPHGQPPTEPLPPLDAQAAARLVPTAPAARAPTRTTGSRRYQGTPVGIAVNPRVPAGKQAP